MARAAQGRDQWSPTPKRGRHLQARPMWGDIPPAQWLLHHYAPIPAASFGFLP